MTEQHRTTSDDSIVKKGGIGSDADAEDVTRDTYGFAASGAATSGLTAEEARQRLEEILPDEAVAPGDSSEGKAATHREE